MYPKNRVILFCVSRGVCALSSRQRNDGDFRNVSRSARLPIVCVSHPLATGRVGTFPVLGRTRVFAHVSRAVVPDDGGKPGRKKKRCRVGRAPLGYPSSPCVRFTGQTCTTGQPRAKRRAAYVHVPRPVVVSEDARAPAPPDRVRGVYYSFVRR